MVTLWRLSIFLSLFSIRFDLSDIILYTPELETRLWSPMTHNCMADVDDCRPSDVTLHNLVRGLDCVVASSSLPTCAMFYTGSNNNTWLEIIRLMGPEVLPPSSLPLLPSSSLINIILLSHPRLQRREMKKIT
jgi:hypothetical protein